MKQILTIIFCLLATYTANAQRTFPADKHPASYQGEQLIVGRGDAEYLLLADGGVYRHKAGNAAYEKLGEQTKANIKSAFSSLTKIKFTEITFNHPNKKSSYFIRYKNNGKTHETAWGDPAYKTPESLTKVYKSFMGMIPTDMRF